MTEGNTSSSDPDASTDANGKTGFPAENTSERGDGRDHLEPSGDDTADTSVMARALKHELERKGMTVEVEADGETVVAEKFDQTYRIHPDGNVEGDGVLKEGIEEIVANLGTSPEEAVEEQEVVPELDSEPDPDEAEDDQSGDDIDDTENIENPKDADDSTTSPDAASTSEGEETEPATDTPGETYEVPNRGEGNDAGPVVEDESATEDRVDEDEDADDEAETLSEGPVGHFEASIEANHLKKVIDAAHAIVDECRVHLDTDKLVIRAVDPANVAMVDEHVSADAFEAYDTECGEIGINLDRLVEVIGIADNQDDLVQFDLDAKTRKLDVQVNAVEYTLALIDPEAIRMEPDIPDLDLPASFSVGQDDFKRAIRAADMVSDHVWFRVDADEACFIAGAEGDTDDVELEVDGEDLENADLHAADSLFSLDYLKDLRKPLPKDTTVDVQLGKEFPVVLGFELADGAIDITYMLAPRIQGD